VPARWYVDADTLGLAKVLVEVRRDVTFPGDDGRRTRTRWSLPPSPVQDTATPDDVWIPAVARAGLAIITRDRRIETRTSEINAVVSSRARMFAITSDEQLDNWGLLEVVVTQWRHLESAAEEPGPFIYAVTRSGLRRLSL
jgi:hypothetical protein